MRHARTRSLAAAAISASLLAGTLAVGTASSATAAQGSQAFPGGVYRPANTTASRAATALRAQGDTANASIAQSIAAKPSSVWLGDWFTNAALASTVRSHLTAAAAQGTTPVFVTYAIPNRDCGSYSAGGLTPSAYGAWNRTLADTIRGHHAAVIVEPDALAQLPSCAAADTATRYRLMRDAVQTLAGAGASVYIDAGHENWIAPSTMAAELRQAGVQYARGFALNVSNSYSTAGERAYGEQLRKLTGKNYVIDVSRNGRGATGEWCNARGAALGQSPTVVNDSTGLDALLWVKLPGESDGTCNGGPAAGQWYAAAAAWLTRNR